MVLVAQLQELAGQPAELPVELQPPDSETGIPSKVQQRLGSAPGTSCSRREARGRRACKQVLRTYEEKSGLDAPSQRTADKPTYVPSDNTTQGLS